MLMASTRRYVCVYVCVQVVGAIRHKRASGEMDGEYKKLLGKLLRLHPDYYSMWNFRKEAVLQEVGHLPGTRNTSSITSLLL